MIVKEKMRAMSRMAMFETSKEGKEALKTLRFFRTDFIRWEILKTVVSVSLGYAIILALIGFYHLEYLIKNATKLNYKGMGLQVLGIYIIIMIIYISYTIINAAYKFSQSRKRYLRYEKNLKELVKYYDREEDDKEESHDRTFSNEG